MIDSKNILVTGAAGFIGSNFVRYILSSDPTAAVVSLDLACNYPPTDARPK